MSKRPQLLQQQQQPQQPRRARLWPKSRTSNKQPETTANPKNATQNIKRGNQIHSKISPSEHLGEKKHSKAVQDPKKLNFRSHVPQDACQNDSKFYLQETPRRAKMETLYHMPKNIAVGYCLESPKQAFAHQDRSLWDTSRRT